MTDDGFNLGVLYARAAACLRHTAAAPAPRSPTSNRSSCCEQQGRPVTLEDFMRQAYALEREAVERYTDFADAMEVHNNRGGRGNVRTMAGYEAKHAAQIMAEMGWTQPRRRRRAASAEEASESPEAVPIDDVHYLMQPWHALQLALAAEQRAEAFFGALAAAT